MTQPLAAVRRAARRRNEAAEAYRRSIFAARVAGYSIPAIAKASGTSKQAIQQLLKRNEPIPEGGADNGS